MKKGTASSRKRGTNRVSTRGTGARRSTTVRRSTNQRRGRRKTILSTKTIAIITAVLVAALFITILCTQVFNKQLSHLFAKKYAVTDVDGSERKLTADEISEEVETDRFYPGISVDGVDVSGKTLAEARNMFAEIRGQQVDELVDIKFQVGNDQVKLKTSGTHLSSNIDEILNEAFVYAKSSSLEGGDGLVERYQKIVDLKKNPKNFTSSFTIGDENISALTHEVLDEYNYAPVEAKATGFDVETLSFVIEESKSGQTVDIEKAIADVKSAFAENNYKAVIPVTVSAVEPKTTAESLRAKLGKVSSNTSKTKDNANRNTNIYLICKAIDGTVLQPGEQFDFNARTGQRTPEKGYKEAPGIANGTSVPEYGGGICQANTMLYHSVMEADLQVDFRVAHSWPSDYVDDGTDATVSWDWPTFKFTNNTDYPVAIHAWYGDRWVTVEIYGRKLPDGQTIKFFGDPVLLIDEEPTETEYVADPTLPVGQKVKERAAHNHKLAKAYKVKYDADGNEIKRDEILTEYRMIKAKYRIGTLASDGTIFNMDPKTGEVTPPSGYTQPTQPTETTAPPETTVPPETTKPPETSTPPETTPAPTSQQTENPEG